MTNHLIDKQLSVNEHSIRYLEGRGIASDCEPILFLHGWGVGIEPYQEILKILGQRYQVIAPELPGFGKSSGSNLNWDYNDYARFLITFLNILNIKKVHIIGHSLGGGIAATIAASMPIFVQSIILVDSTGIPVEPLAKILVQRAIEMTAQTPQIQFPQIIQVFTAFTYNFILQTQNTIQLLLLALTKDLTPLLPKIESRCLLVWGANDLTTPLSAAQDFLRLIKNAKLVVVEDVYHEWSIFFVEKFTNIVFNFIDEIEAQK